MHGSCNTTQEKLSSWRLPSRALRPPVYPDDAEYAPTTLPRPVCVCLSSKTHTHRRAPAAPSALGKKAKRSVDRARKSAYESAEIFFGDGTGQPITHGVHAAEADWRGELRGTWAGPAPAPLPDDRPAFCNQPMKSF
jgi:hypothetical protein